MGMFLNHIVPHENFRAIAAGPYFVDKSAILDEQMPARRRGDAAESIERRNGLWTVFLPAGMVLWNGGCRLSAGETDTGNCG